MWDESESFWFSYLGYILDILLITLTKCSTFWLYVISRKVEEHTHDKDISHFVTITNESARYNTVLDFSGRF